MTADRPVFVFIALAVAALLLWRGRSVRALLPRGARRIVGRAAFPLGGLMLGLALAGIEFSRDRTPRVVVLVDVSMSTRGARYHEPAFLAARLGRLMPGQRAETIFFADGTVADGSGTLIDSERTRLPSVDADAVVLFSDGRFAIDAAGPPTFAVMDANLIAPPDARVSELEFRDDHLVATISTTRDATLDLDGAATRLPPGNRVVFKPIEDGDQTPKTARVNAGDRWPENDTLVVAPPPTTRAARIWVSDDGTIAPAGWQHVSPAAGRPAFAAAIAGAAVIALAGDPDTGAAPALSPALERDMIAFVRDLGGTLIVADIDQLSLGLRALTPLSSAPPAPPTRVALLLDRSGSMAALVDGAGEARTRWSAVTSSLAPLLAALRPDTPVTIGAFARDVAWWNADVQAKEVDVAALPLAAAPAGPTNLHAAIVALNDRAALGPLTAVLLTDGGAALAADTTLAENLTLVVLATQPLPADSPLGRLANRVVTEPDPARWPTALAGVGRSLAETPRQTTPLAVKYLDLLTPLGGRTIDAWSRRWPKAGATPLASGVVNSATKTLMAAKRDASSEVVAAVWPVGLGRFAELAYSPNTTELDLIATALGRPAVDPRVRVTWSGTRDITVTLETAAESVDPVSPGLRLFDPPGVTNDAPRVAFRQTAPGIYEATFPAARTPKWAVIEMGGHVVARRELAGRYAQEFDAIGVDVDALRRLAARTGGAVIGPAHEAPLKLPALVERRVLTPWLSLSGGMFVALGLLALHPPDWWRLSTRKRVQR